QTAKLELFRGVLLAPLGRLPIPLTDGVYHFLGGRPALREPILCVNRQDDRGIASLLHIDLRASPLTTAQTVQAALWAVWA
ncbi:MAG: hypothetical protein AAB363_07905, partial [Planctomycetota bacterium]